MRDYTEIFTAIIYDDPITATPRISFWKDKSDFEQANWFALYEALYTNPIEIAEPRWYGIADRDAIISILNAAFFEFANVDVFVSGSAAYYEQRSGQMDVFTASPRDEGYSSFVEKGEDTPAGAGTAEPTSKTLQKQAAERTTAGFKTTLLQTIIDLYRTLLSQRQYAKAARVFNEVLEPYASGTISDANVFDRLDAIAKAFGI